MADDAIERDPRFPDALAPGTEVGGYVIHRVLGQGGFGITYEAGNAAGVLSRKVVIKEFFVKGFTRREGRTVVPVDATQAEIIASALARFEAEAQKIVDELDHPNVVRGEAFLRLNGSAFLVLDYIDGMALTDWREMRREPPAEREIRRIMEPILDATAYLHSRDALHRDISPSNIMIRMRHRERYVEEPVLIDFGAVRTGLDVVKETSIGPHNPAYCAPEQLARGARLGSYTDIFAIGGVLHFLVTGQAPVGGTARQHETAITKKDPYPKLSEMSPPPDGFSPRFLAGIDAALALPIQERPQSITELKAALGWDKPTSRPGAMASGASQGEATWPISVQPPIVDPPAPPPGGGLRGWMIAAVLVLAVGIGGATWWMMSGAAPQTDQRQVLDAAGYDRAKIEAYLAQCGTSCLYGQEASQKLAAIAADDRAYGAAQGDAGALQSYLSSCATPCAHTAEASRAIQELAAAQTDQSRRQRAALDGAGWSRAKLETFLADCGANCPLGAEARRRIAAIDADDMAFRAAAGNLGLLLAYRANCAAPCAHRAEAQGQIDQLQQQGERRQRQQDALLAAGWNRDLLVALLSSCGADCAIDAEARGRIAAIDADERAYDAARGNLARLRAYRGGCETPCAHRAAAQAEISQLEAALPQPTPAYQPTPQPQRTAQRCVVFGTSGAAQDPWLALRSEPSTQIGGRLRVMYDGTQLEVLGQSGSWVRVRALDDGSEGWAYASYVRCSGEAPRPTVTTCHVYGTSGAQKDPWLALRSEPSTQSGGRLRIMYDGTRLQVLDRNGVWLRVRALDDGSVGWAHGNYITCP